MPQPSVSVAVWGRIRSGLRVAALVLGSLPHCLVSRTGPGHSMEDLAAELDLDAQIEVERQVLEELAAELSVVETPSRGV